MVRIGLASVVLLSLLAACGGGGEGTAPTPSAPGSPTPPAVNAVPTASAGASITANKGDLVTLDGSASSDPEGAALAYRWTQTSGPAVTLSSATAAKPSFTAPVSTGTLVFSLVVSDGVKDSEAKTVSVQVNDRAPTPQVAAQQQAVPNAPVLLDASASSDPDGDPLTFTWTQTSGPTVTFTVTGAGQIRFTAPGTAATLTFQVSVSDGSGTPVTATISVQVAAGTPTNRAPFASAGADQNVGRGQGVALQGVGGDPDGNRVTYRWEQVAGTPVTLNGADTPWATFFAPAQVGDLRFSLRVSDGTASTTDEIVVKVVDLPPYIYNAAIAPDAPKTRDDLSFAGTIMDPDADPLTITYEWSRNGAVVAGQTGATFPASLTTRNDVIKVHVTAKAGTHTVMADATTTVLDSPPVMSATPPTTIQHGASISFQISATDDDGDAIPGYVLSYGPAGMQVSNGGTVTWTASGPMFDRTMNVGWGVELSGFPGARLTGTLEMQDPTRRLPLRRTSLGAPQYPGAMQVVDLDADGVAEILIHNGSSLYELARLGSGYEQRWVHPFAIGSGDATVAAVAAADVNGSAAKEIFVSDAGAVVRLDGASRREMARYKNDTGTACVALAVADLDGDGTKEVVCLESGSYSYTQSQRIRLLSATTLQPFWSSATGLYGETLAVGNVDGDAPLEIVTSGGYVFDGATHANEWAASNAFGDVIAVGDADGDGVGEIFSGSGVYNGAPNYNYQMRIVAWNARTHAQAWAFNVPGLGCCSVDSMVAADLTSDGRTEIIIGNDQWNSTVAITYDVSSQAASVLWSQANSTWGSVALGAGDVDGDGKVEVVWANGGSTQGGDIVVAGMNPGVEIEWRSSNSQRIDGPFVGGTWARIGSTRRALIFGSQRSNANNGGFRAVAFDPVTGSVELSADLGSNWSNAGAIDTADVDQDGIEEVLVGTVETYQGRFRTLDFAGGTTEWLSPLDLGTPRVMTHADCTGDGRPEVIGMTDGKLYVYDPNTQTEIERIEGVGLDVIALEHGAMGKCDLVTGTSNAVAVYRHGPSGLQKVSERTFGVGVYLRDLAVGDLDGDGAPEIVLLSSDYFGATITTYDYQLNPVASFIVNTLIAGLNTLAVHGVDIEKGAGSRRNLLITVGEQLYFNNPAYRLQAMDPWSGAEVWRSPRLEGNPTVNGLHYVDTDADGALELSLASSSGMMLTR